MAGDPCGGTDLVPTPADAELEPKDGSATSLHDSPAVEAVEAVDKPPRHRQVDPGR